MQRYLSIFTSGTAEERRSNFESYWIFSQRHAGELLEKEKDLSNKRDKLNHFKKNPVRSRLPLPDPEAFYRNCVRLRDAPSRLDRKVLLLTCIYKFARHEWSGIQGAWDATPTMSDSRRLTDQISRVHLAEEFCHVRLFQEMLQTFHLARVEWVPVGPFMKRVYRIFPRLPGFLMDAPAFVTELLGMVFYLHLNALFDRVLADEPEAHDRLRELLTEIMIDELAHVGQRRNFIGPIGIRCARLMIKPLFRTFFNDIPEARHLFDIDRMIEDALAFDYNNLPDSLLRHSWIPSYCHARPKSLENNPSRP
ncbi:hypothetical protein ACWJKU_08825 [Methylocaldum sp. MU1018]